MTWKYTDQSRRVVISDDGRQSMLASVLPEGTPIADPDGPTLPERIAEREQALTAHINACAAARRWDSIDTAASRAGYAGPYQAEGIAWGQWRDACWQTALALMADVLAGKAQEPTAAELIAAMPPPPTFHDELIMPPKDTP